MSAESADSEASCAGCGLVVPGGQVGCQALFTWAQAALEHRSPK